MYVTTKGLGLVMAGGQVLPSTPDPANTPIVMNPTPGENFQAAVTSVPEGTLSSSGQACDTAGGYVWNGSQCVQSGQQAAPPEAPAGFVIASDPATGAAVLIPGSSAPSSSTVAANAVPSSAASQSTTSLFGLSTSQLLIGAAVLIALWAVSR